jgi:quinol monooxygenase YgiN
MIYVLATIEITPGKRSDFLREFHANVPNVVAEEGCLEYVPAIDVQTNLPAQGGARDNVVVVVEKWASLAALEAHLVAPHMLEYRKKVKDLVVRVGLQILEPAA